MRQGTTALLFLAVLIVVYLLVPKAEKFVTLTGAKDGKSKGLPCEFDAECASDICLHYNSPDGLQHTCA